MTSASNPFDARVRAELQAMLVANGVAPLRALEICDIACHAAETATANLLETCGRADSYGSRMMAVELGLQLAVARMKAVLERTRDLGRATGCPTWQGEVGIAL